jgi:hypothetical protein
MAIVLKDRVKESTAVTGTGTATLLGAAAGYQAFSVIGNGNTTYYAIVDAENGTWEVGTGTYTSSGNTLSRTTVFESSNAGTLVDFAAGAKDVFITYPAERAIYEEPSGNTLIDGGPLTVVGSGVTGYTSFSAVLAELYGNVDSFAQIYAQNLNDGSSASADLVAYNDLGDGLTNFVDVGINSSNYTSVDYPIFTPSSAYLFNDGGEMFVGSATDDVVFFAGGVDTTDEAARIDKTTKALTTVADVNVGGALDVTGATTFGSTVLLNQDPTLALQAVTKQYVDNATSNGFHVHTPVLVATTGNLTATYSNGTAGVGATLTNSGAQAAISIDGVSLSVADRVLVWQQATGAQNGVYVVTTVGSGATNWVLTRSSDADTSSEGDPNSLGGGDYFFVSSGATLGFYSFVCTNDGTITFGTTAITFTEFSQVPSYNVVAPLNLSGNTLSLTGTVAATNGGTGNATVTTGDLLYGSGTNTWGKLAAGSAYKSLVMNAGGTQVEWDAVALNQSGAVSGSLPATNGGTGQSAYAVGDILYSGTTNTLSKLSGNTTTTKKYLIQTGTGSASAAPAWGTIAGADVSGNISGNAGSATNVAGGAANRIVYNTGSGATAFATAPSSSNTFLSWDGSAFAWAAAGGDVPSGSVMLFKQTSAPTGWTKDTTAALNDSALRVVTGSVTTGGSVAFTTAFASQGVSGTVGSTTAGGSVSVTLSGGGSVSGTTLSTAQIPSHTHGVTYYNNDGDAYSPRGIGKTSYVSADGTQNTGAAGSGGSHSHGFSNPSYSGSFSGASHNHTFSGTAINLAVKYVDIIIATKA